VHPTFRGRGEAELFPQVGFEDVRNSWRGSGVVGKKQARQLVGAWQEQAVKSALPLLLQFDH
jgi:hypothetical protein